MVELPSLGKWLSTKSLFFQVNFSMMMKVAPLFIIIYGYTICKTMLGMSQETAFMIPMLVGIMVFGFFISWDYGNRNQSTAYLPLNMTLVWDAATAAEVVTNIIDYVPLKEKPEENVYAYMVKFDMPLEDDKNEKFQHAIFIAHHPMDKTFRRLPGQFVAFSGSVFEGMAARIVATYCNEFLDIQGISRDEMVMGQFKVFHVKWCLEDSKMDQIKLGLYQETSNGINKEIVMEGAKLEIDRKATRIGMMLREAEGQLRSFSEAYKDVETKSKETINRIIDDQERIKKERSLMTRILKDRWVRVILIIIAVGVFAYTLRYYKVI